MAVSISGDGAITGMVSASSSDLSTELDAKLDTPGAWTSYTPTLTAATTSPTLGSGSFISGRYSQIGKTVFVSGSLAFGSGMSAGSGQYYISVPVPAAGLVNINGWVWAYDSSAGAGRIFLAADWVTSTKFNMYQALGGAGINVTESGPIAWATNDQLRWHLTYEAA